MKSISPEYRLEEMVENPPFEVIHGVPVVDTGNWLGSGYETKKTDYEQDVAEGLHISRVTEKELDPFTKGWYRHIAHNGEAVDWESHLHEYVHSKGYGEHETRKIMRNLLNFYGKRGDYHQ